MEKLEVLKRNIDVFLTDMMSKEEYNHLNISVNIMPDSTLPEEIRVDSNAALSVKNSIKATNLISGEIRTQLKSLDVNTSIVANITFSTKSIESPVGKVKKNTKDGKNKTSFVCEKPKYRLEDVILPDDTRRELEETIALMSNFDKVYREWNFYSKEPSAKTNICFYGMPGTGKTMCAHGIAQHLNMPILIASYADIQSEYVGVGPKNLRDVFKTAEENNALLFFDEADSFLRKRTSDTSSSAAMHYNSMTNEMMNIIVPAIFDPELYASKLVQADGVDVLKESAMNYYEGVSQAEAERFYAKMAKKNDPRPISYGLNSKLVKEGGKIYEKTYKVGGMYSKAIEQIVYWLEKAAGVAAEPQKSTILTLVEYYKTGDLRLFDEFNIAWTKDTESYIDYVNGFTILIHICALFFK